MAKEYLNKYVCDGCKKEIMAPAQNPYGDIGPRSSSLGGGKIINPIEEFEDKNPGWEEVHTQNGNNYLMCSEECIIKFFPVIFEEEKSFLLEVYRKNQLSKLKK